MTANIGPLDRIIRFVLGLLLLVAPFVSGMAFFVSTTATVLSVLVGVILLTTAILRFCPMYHLFGIRTCRL